MFNKLKFKARTFFRGSHHKLNGYNLLVIIVMLFVMAYHVSLSNQNVPQFVTNKKLTNDPTFFRSPASESQKTFRKSRQLGYAEYKVQKDAGSENWVIAVFPKESNKQDLKYKWILREGVTHVSGNLEGSINMNDESSIDLVIGPTTNPAQNLLAIEIYHEGNVKTGYVQQITLMDASEDINLGQTKSTMTNETVPDSENSKKKIKIFQ